MATAGTYEVRVRQPTRQRQPGAMSVEIVAAMLGALESKRFDGTVEIQLRAGRMLAVHQAPLPAEEMHGGMDANHKL